MTNNLPSLPVHPAIHLLQDIAGHYRSYHDHKESMAYAGFALYSAAFGALLVTNRWPPAWLLCASSNTRIWACLALILVFCIAMLFVSWQLRNRRLAALRYAGAIRLLVIWMRHPPVDRDLRPWKPQPETGGFWSSLLKLIWPPCAPIPRGDLPREAYPGALSKYWYVQEKGLGTGAKFHEHIIVGTMWLLLIAAVIRTLAF